MTFGTIFIPHHVTIGEQRAKVAHTLGHHFLHVGNQHWLWQRDWVWAARQEHQAEEFAAWLTVPASEDADLLYMAPAEMARTYRITEELARVRLGS